MSNLIAWIGAEAERPEIAASAGFPRRTRQGEEQARERDLPEDEVLHEIEPPPEMVEALFLPATAAGGRGSRAEAADVPRTSGGDVAAVHAVLD